MLLILNITYNNTRNDEVKYYFNFYLSIFCAMPSDKTKTVLCKKVKIERKTQ